MLEPEVSCSHTPVGSLSVSKRVCLNRFGSNTDCALHSVRIAMNLVTNTRGYQGDPHVHSEQSTQNLTLDETLVGLIHQIGVQELILL